MPSHRHGRARLSAGSVKDRYARLGRRGRSTIGVVVAAVLALLGSQVVLQATASSAPAGHGREHARPAHHSTATVRRVHPVKRPSAPRVPGGSVAAAAVPPTPATPFAQCPAVGADTSCAVLVQVTDGGNRILDDPSQGPYDGVEDTMVGVVNNSSTSISALALASDTDLFGFDGDGLCTFGVAGCPFGPTGYEGPGTSFANINQNASGGVVIFTPGLAPGATAYFSLEERLAATDVVAGGPSAAEQGRAPNRSERPTTCPGGDPVNCATGDFWHTVTDLAVPGRGARLQLDRTYESALAAVDGPFGFGWSDSYGMSLATNSDGTVTVTQENGATVDFKPNGTGGFKPAAPRVLATLDQATDGTFTFTRRADLVRHVFSATGQLTAVTDRAGETTTLAYTGGQLTSVTDPAGRALTFTYTGAHVTRVTDPMGRHVDYRYDTAGNLVGTTDAAGRAWAFTYDRATCC